MIECPLFPLSNFCLMPPHPLLILFYNRAVNQGRSGQRAAGWGMHWGCFTLHPRACASSVSLQLWAHSTAVLSTWLSSPAMPGHHQVCPTRLGCYENLVLQAEHIPPLPFSYHWQVIFLKVTRAQSEIWASCLLQLCCGRCVISLWGRGGEGRAASFPCRSGTTWERKCREKTRKMT